MKKILWLIFLNIILINFVSAKVYYSDYSDFSEFQEKEIIASDTIDVIKEERYLWYRDKEILRDYQLYNEYDKFSDDCYLTEYSGWMDQKFDNIGYIYETRNKYKYTLAKGIRYIHLYNLQGSYGSFRIPELEIKYNNKSLNYTYTCSGCLEGFDDYIHNGIYEENESYIANGGNLVIDLGKIYPINLIETNFYIFDLGPSDKIYTIGYSTDKKNIFYSKNYNLQFSSEYWKNAVKRVHNVTDLNINDWQYYETTTEFRNDEFVINQEISKEYRYQEKWCKVYNYEKEYSDYSKNPVDDYVNRVDESLKTFYSYRTRDKLELDIKEITEKNYDLNNFVISSTADVKIENNINWDKNGFYDVKFQVNDLIVNEKINLNVESNTIDDLNQQIIDLKNYYEKKLQELENKLEYYQKDNDSLIKKINELKKTYEEEISNLHNIIINYENDIENKEQLNQLYLNKIKELEEDISNLNDGIGNIVKENEEKLDNCKIENSNLYSQLENYQKLNKDLENKVVNSENIEMPKFMLKIGFLDSKFILVIFLLLLYIAYLIGKKSNKK